MTVSSGQDWGDGLRHAMVALAALTFGCSPAFSEGREMWRCNVPNGHWDELVLPIDDRSTSITGRILFHRADPGAQWASSASIDFKQRGLPASQCNCSGLGAYVGNATDGLQMQMRANGQTSPIGPATFETPIKFKISVDPKGVMTVQIGDTNPQTRSVMLRRPERNILVMGCSGADVSFMDIDVR